MQIEGKIGIPRDPRDSNIAFISEVPLLLVDKIDSQIYKECLDIINSVFKPKVSLSSFLKALTVIFSLTSDQKSFDREVEGVLLEVNDKMKMKGLSFLHPKYTNYTELVLYIHSSE